ncbi:hypothetical protein ACSNOJ_15890 [Streptomyces sp. URMC 128]
MFGTTKAFSGFSMNDIEAAEGTFRGGGPLIAWFTDPAGNVLPVLQET